MIRKIAVAAAACALSFDAYCIDGAGYWELSAGAWDNADESTAEVGFAEHAGIGMHSGKHDFGVRIQHLSNGGVRSPNPGVNFVTVRVQYSLE
ncbi:MAG TPA: acyloxyacyl hydrolase [Burkholderiales bacterium]|nr:acyloxyacyl hydrolase [Burkholderiales bacterium]